MQQALVSIIVPMYNAAGSIKKCLQSILAQTYTEIEVIVVDDGSTDSGNEIVKTLTLTDNRLNIIYQANNGQASARNNGIEKSNGEYLFFVDSDDWIHPKTIGFCVEMATTLSLDITGISYQTVGAIERVHTFPSDELGQKEIFTKSLYSDEIGGFCWGKLYKKKLLVDNGLQFPEGIFYEDVALMPQIYAQAKNIKFFNEPLYYYFVSSKSTVGFLNDKKLSDKVKAIEILKEKFKCTEYEHLIITKALSLVVLSSILTMLKTEINTDLFNKIRSYPSFKLNNILKAKLGFTEKVSLLMIKYSFPNFRRLYTIMNKIK